jgi:hypothetical protein
MWFMKRFDDSMWFTFREIRKEAKKYKGWDWAEVYHTLDLDSMSPDHKGKFNLEKMVAGNEICYDRLRGEIDTVFREMPPCGKGLSARSEDVLLACRAYAYAAGILKKSHDYKKPMWRGLSVIRDDGEFLKMYKHVFPYIWD